MATDKPDEINRVWASQAASGDIEDIEVSMTGKTAIGYQAEEPKHEHFNHLFKYITQALAHINQHGIPKWDPNTTYPTGALTLAGDHVLYKAKTTNVGEDPVNSTQWGRAFYDASSSINADTLDGYDSAYFLPRNAKSINSDLLDGYDHTQFWKKGEEVSSSYVGGYAASQIWKKDEQVIADRLRFGSPSTTFTVDQFINFLQPSAGGVGFNSRYITFKVDTGVPIIFCFGRGNFGNYDQTINLPVTYPNGIAGAWTSLNSNNYTETRALISSNSQIIIGANSSSNTSRSWLTVGW